MSEITCRSLSDGFHVLKSFLKLLLEHFNELNSNELERMGKYNSSNFVYLIYRFIKIMYENIEVEADDENHLIIMELNYIISKIKTNEEHKYTCIQDLFNITIHLTEMIIKYKYIIPSKCSTIPLENLFKWIGHLNKKKAVKQIIRCLTSAQETLKSNNGGIYNDLLQYDIYETNEHPTQKH